MIRVGILAGGLGTRLAEQTDVRPKPMVEVGGQPLLWHLMKGYGAAGFTEFAIALGYRGETIKDFFLHYRHRASSVRVRLGTGEVTLLDDEPPPEDWTVHLIDTGLATQTGGRIRRLAPVLGDGTFMLTYGDAVSDVSLPALLRFHRAHGRLVTVTAVRPAARFGELEFEGTRVARFAEKPQTTEGWVNGGFFVMERRAVDYIAGDDTVWEREPLEALARDGELMAFRHDGFWHCVDTLRDLRALEGLWQGGEAPWRVWA